ncbi:MAG TPA: hypothetical protein VMB47_07490 [Candidatus Aquilonibacter sp.]|nr:hypothetical protein [Candidatus Aquilonibacter sp.]
MVSPLYTVIYVLGLILEAAVVVCVCMRRNYLAYLPVGFYMLCSAVTTIGSYFCIRQFGWGAVYRYYYYYSDATMTVLLFWVVIHFYQKALAQLQVSKYIRVGTAVLISLTALFSYVVISKNREHLTGRFVIELSQNLYFEGVVLTYVLWCVILKLKETRAQLAQLVLALGIYFAGIAVAYAIRNLFAGFADSILAWVPPIMSTWLAVAWIYTLAHVSEDTILITSQLEARVPA